MEKDTKNSFENENLLKEHTDDLKADFDAMFDEEDIKTWGNDVDGERIAANAMHAK